MSFASRTSCESCASSLTPRHFRRARALGRYLLCRRGRAVADERRPVREGRRVRADEEVDRAVVDRAVERHAARLEGAGEGALGVAAVLVHARGRGVAHGRDDAHRVRRVEL